MVIEYWEKWVGVEAEALQRIVDRFNQSQGRVWVRTVQVSDIAAKAAVAIGGGDPPDVVGLYSYNIPQFAESGAALALDGFGSADGQIDPESFAPAVRRLLTYQGRLWAGVNTIYNLALYYNRAMFREAGLDPAHPPRTIAELDAAADRLVVRGPGGRLERAGFLPSMPDWWPYSWPIMFGGTLYDAAANRAVFTDPATVAAYEWVQGCPRRLGLRESSEFGHAYSRSYHTAQDPFISGRVAMIVQGPWIANFIRRCGPGLDYGAASLPVAESILDPERPVGLLEADVLMIPRGCRHPEEAFGFVRFMQRPEIQEMLATEHCKSSPMRDISEGFVKDHPNRFVSVHDAIARSPRVQILPQTRVWQQYADMTIGAFERVWSGQPVLPVLQGVETRAQMLMDRAALRRKQRSESGSTGA